VKIPRPKIGLLEPVFQTLFLLQSRLTLKSASIHRFVYPAGKGSAAILPSMLPKLPPREAAVRGMEEFGEKYRLSLGEPITRKFLHEGHRY
jgi:hypothetical protein